MDPMVASSLISGGVSLLGGLMGKKSSSSGAKALKAYAAALDKAMNFQTGLYKDYKGITDPFRAALYPDIINTLKSEDPYQYITGLPFYKNIRTPLEDQYKVARENLAGSIPSSATGAFTRAMTELEAMRAQGVGAIPGNIYKDYWAAGMGIAEPKMQEFQQGVGMVAQAYGPAISSATQQISAGNAMMANAGVGLGRALSDIMGVAMGGESGTTGSSFGNAYSDILGYRYGFEPDRYMINADLQYIPYTPNYDTTPFNIGVSNSNWHYQGVNPETGISWGG